MGSGNIEHLLYLTHTHNVETDDDRSSATAETSEPETELVQLRERESLLIERRKEMEALLASANAELAEIQAALVAATAEVQRSDYLVVGARDLRPAMPLLRAVFDGVSRASSLTLIATLATPFFGPTPRA